MTHQERGRRPENEFIAKVHDELRAVYDFWLLLEIGGPHMALPHFGDVIRSCQAVHELIEPGKVIEAADLFCTVVFLTDIIQDDSSRPSEFRPLPYEPTALLDLTDIAALCEAGWRQHQS